MKNFIRGCGMGIIIATLILAITYMLVEDDISDSEVIARAKKLGMVEADSTIIRQQEATPESVQPETPSEGDAALQPPEGEQPPEDIPQSSEGDSQETIVQTTSEQPSEEPVPEATPTPQPQTDNGGADTVSFTIKSGQDGVTVCYMLQEKGIISDAMDFSNYLSQNRMQTNIRPGTFELEKDMSYEELVKKIVW